MSNRAPVLGAVLAGGEGRRLGGAKTTVLLNRRPLLEYAVEALWRALGNVVIVSKADTVLPSLPRVSVWIEPDEPHHPLMGVVHALSLAEGRPVLICACDLPLVSPELVRALAEADPGPAEAVIACAGERMQPLLGCYHPGTLGPLLGALDQPGIPVQAAVEALEPRRLQVDDDRLLLNVNTPEELLQAGTLLHEMGAERRRRGISRT